MSLPKDKAASLEAAFEAQHLFLRRVGYVEEGAGVLVKSMAHGWRPERRSEG